MAYGPFEDVRAMAEWLEAQARGEDPLFYAVFDRGQGRHVGMASFVNIAPESRRLEIGHIWLAPEVHRTKVATELSYLMLRHGFEDLAMRRIEWKCDFLNAASRRAALRLGFEFEGIFRKHLIVKGRNRDTAWYSMLDDDWPVVGRRSNPGSRATGRRRWPDSSRPRPGTRTSAPARPPGSACRRRSARNPTCGGSA